MKKLNIIITFFVVLLLMTAFYGYVGAQAQETTIILHLGSSHPASDTTGQSLLAFVKAVEKLSKGRIKILPHFQDLSRSERDFVDMEMSGDLDIMCICPSVLSAYGMNYFEIFDLPLIFDTAEQASIFMNSDTMKKISERLYKELGLKALDGGSVSYGKTGRAITSSKPVRCLEDLQGLKIRVVESPLYVKTYKYLGLKPTPLPFGQVFSALQTKLVNAVEIPITAVISQGYYEHAKYTTLFSVLGLTMQLFVSGETWESLSPEDREILQEANIAYKEANFSLSQGLIDENIKILKEKGVQFYDFKKEDIPVARERLREAMADDFNRVKKMFDFLGYNIYDATAYPENYGGKMLEFKYYSPAETWEPIPW